MLTDAIDGYGVYSNRNLKEFIYSLEQRFPVCDEVEFFSQLVNFSKNREIPYHGWFQYREGYSYALVRELLKRSKIKHSEYVLDPFCGSGTTIVEAARNGYSGLGMDINPMSAFLSRVKCQSYSDAEVDAIHVLLQKLPEIARREKTSYEYIKKYQEVKKFFNEHNFTRLLAVRQAIDSKKEQMGQKLYELCLCAYICIIEEVSDRKRDGNGLKTQLSRISDVEGFFAAKLEKMAEDISQNRISEKVVSVLEYGNAMKLSEAAEQYSGRIQKPLGAIVYSPPYANSFDYFESYKMEVILADYAGNMKDISTYRHQAVESFIGRLEQRNKNREFVEWMSKEIEEAIPEKEARTGKTDVRTRKVPKMIKGYFNDMENVISESSKVLGTGKKCYIVVDQSAYLGRIVPTDLFLAAIGECYQFRVTDIIVCRIAKTSSQQIQLYPYLKDSLRESIVVLEKM